MAINLSTHYGGIALKNPIVIGASNIVTDPENLVKLEKAGAAAIVYKSLFEEQLQLEQFQLEQQQEAYSNWDAEHDTFFPRVKHAGPAEHILRLRDAKRKISIPLIGSLNCTHDETWEQFAVEMAGSGIDGLELNFYNNNTYFDLEANEIERKQLQTLKRVRAAVNIPIFVKLSPYYSNPLRMIELMDQAQADGFVLFNRLFQPDIDIDKEEHHFPYNFSSEADNRLALRYAGLLHKKVSGSIISNTGVHNGRDVVKMLLAGADAVQVVSAVYKKGIQYIETMLSELEGWMKKKGYESLDDFRGKLSKENLADPFAYKRAQYVDILMKSEIFMQYHPKRGELDHGHDDL
ncbi:MAG: dihydroorotate dehydrogenase-like protein [Cyclobacteriaceae bacterium]|jgi:dihydroorotate dehydrogenase (fumarate)|nr:dihydroorotate dehydrogenase-like protein [Flammeovirgaceae bacterium]MCZ8069130.1 dihydroorotate dehydrogenase-like protein [Cytophagales bacterium]